MSLHHVVVYGTVVLPLLKSAWEGYQDYKLARRGELS